MIVLDAAVLLEARWHSMVHEVWTTLVPKDEVFIFHLHFLPFSEPKKHAVFVYTFARLVNPLRWFVTGSYVM